MRFIVSMLAMAACHFIVALPAHAQGDDSAAPQPCSAAECRQFDFWIGNWTVTANGQIAGTNRISSILGGCVLLEEYESVKGYAGKSFNRYDASDGKWHQLWVDNQGGVLDLAGEFEDGKMIMTGESVTGGETVMNRITWYNNAANGTVRQLWEISKDGGATWGTVFDGLYNRSE